MRGYGKKFRTSMGRATDASRSRMAASAAAPPLEMEVQVKLFQLIDAHVAAIPELKFIRAIPNQSRGRNANTGKALPQAVQRWREGARAGTLDILFPQPRGLYNGLWIELKRDDRKSSWSDEQIQFGRQMLAWGWCVLESREEMDAWNKLLRYISLPPRCCCPVELDGLEPPEVLTREEK